MALSFFSSGRIWLKAMREASSMQTLLIPLMSLGHSEMMSLGIPR
jgi:hypothetical protein